MDGGPVRQRLFPDARGFTIREVRDLCAHLPEPELRPLHHDVDEPTLAATAVPIVEVDGEAAVVLTKRAATMARNRGDWVFPGGRVDRADATNAAAAVREAGEELGVERGRVELLGQLDTHGPIMSGFLVATYVVLLPDGAPFAPPPAEVSAVAVVPLSHFMAEGCFADDRPMPMFDPGPSASGKVIATTIPVSASPDTRTLASFALPDGELLWGLQAEILLDLLERLVRDRVDHRA